MNMPSKPFAELMFGSCVWKLQVKKLPTHIHAICMNWHIFGALFSPSSTSQLPDSSLPGSV